MTTSADPFDLNRFVIAQEPAYASALAELRAGRKQSHWMWFVFPQFSGLGFSVTSQHFAIESIEEAEAYLQHPVLGPRLAECCEALLALKGHSASDIFGWPDDLKLQSCLTLFDHVSQADSVFHKLLAKYFKGLRDERTLELANTH